MLVTNHVLSGALVGVLARRPAAAFAAGVASHAVLDAVPHWGGVDHDDFLRVAVRDGLSGLAAIAAVGVLTHRSKRLAVLAGVAGAVVPDLDKPSVHFFGRSPFPRAVDALHWRIQRESPHRMRQELLVGSALAIATAVAVRRQATGSRRAIPRSSSAANPFASS